LRAQMLDLKRSVAEKFENRPPVPTILYPAKTQSINWNLLRVLNCRP
jgi:hypothetical protein